MITEYHVKPAAEPCAIRIRRHALTGCWLVECNGGADWMHFAGPAVSELAATAIVFANVPVCDRVDVLSADPTPTAYPRPNA